jgi:yeast amino acid transporter
MFDSSDLGRLLGFWAACCQGVFSYLGVEIIGIAADETARQRETLPRAVRRVAYRSIFYHVGAVFVLGINVSADDPILKSFATESYSEGPFVLMAERAGLPALGDWIKVVTILALVSVANTRLYVSVCQCLVSLFNNRVELCMLFRWKDKHPKSSKRRDCGMYRYTA